MFLPDVKHWLCEKCDNCCLKKNLMQQQKKDFGVQMKQFFIMQLFMINAKVSCTAAMLAKPSTEAAA